MWILNVRIQDQFLGSQYFLNIITFPWISRNFYISTHSKHTIIESGARQIYNNLMNFISTLELTLTAKNASCYSIYLELIFFPFFIISTFKRPTETNKISSKKNLWL
jgi:hypothetical protein